jgi:hypothetical protein
LPSHRVLDFFVLLLAGFGSCSKECASAVIQSVLPRCVLVILISLPPVRPGLNLLLGPCSSKCFATSRSLFGFGIGSAPAKHRPSIPCCHFPISRTRLSSRGLLHVHRASPNLASAPGARSHCAQPLYFYSADTEDGCETVGGEIPSCARLLLPCVYSRRWVPVPNRVPSLRFLGRAGDCFTYLTSLQSGAGLPCRSCAQVAISCSC